MFLGIFDIDEYVPIPAATHRFSSGAAYQPTSLTYSIYEEGGTTGLDENVDMTPASPFDSVTGAYLSSRQLTTAAGFERGKTYVAIVKATVDSVSAVEMHIFQIRAAQTGDAYARLGAPAGASVSEDIAALPTATANADALLKRDWSSVTGEAARSVLNALRFLRNKWSLSGTTLTVTKEDDATSAWTATVTTSDSADPVTGSDPT